MSRGNNNLKHLACETNNLKFRAQNKTKATLKCE